MALADVLRIRAHRRDFTIRIRGEPFPGHRDKTAVTRFPNPKEAAEIRSTRAEEPGKGACLQINYLFDIFGRQRNDLRIAFAKRRCRVETHLQTRQSRKHLQAIYRLYRFPHFRRKVDLFAGREQWDKIQERLRARFPYGGERNDLRPKAPYQTMRQGEWRIRSRERGIERIGQVRGSDYRLTPDLHRSFRSPSI